MDELEWFKIIERMIMEKIQYVERMSIATYPYDWNFYDEPEGLESPSDILKEAREEHGDVFAGHLEGVDKAHWPKVYGKEEREVERGYDYLDSFRKHPMRIRKDGKVHRQDIKSRKQYLVHRRGFELEGHCECGCVFTKKSQKLRKNSFYYEYPEKDRRK
tara:strand:- start:291 stop:770 length:480 start_codon:yes stop_codon:yes gene_type:complete